MGGHVHFPVGPWTQGELKEERIHVPITPLPFLA